jgi:hypothetical protein
MKISEINTETNLREWLTDNIHFSKGRLRLEWIEQLYHARSVGLPDVNIHRGNESVGVELKYLLMTRNGIKWTVRPAQRRYHHMHARTGGKSAILAYVPATKSLILVRGNNVPRRDYANHPDSGCKNGEVDTSWRINMAPSNPDENAINLLERYLFLHDYFWEDFDFDKDKDRSDVINHR